MKPQFLPQRIRLVPVWMLALLLVTTISGFAGSVARKSHKAPVRKFTNIKTRKNAPVPAKYKGLLKRLPTMAGEDKAKLANGREDAKGRQDWFMRQRIYPFKSTPLEARRAAFEEAMTQGLEATGEADNFSWRSIGPTPSRSAYFDRNWGALSGRINTIAVSPADAQLVLLGGATGGIWRSTDGGQTLAPVADDQVDLAVGYIAFARSNPSIVYAAMGDGRGVFYGGSYFGTGILKSTDAGKTWKRVSNNSFPAPAGVLKLAIDPVNPDRLYAAQVAGTTNFEAGGIYVSNDGGISWKETLPGWANDVVISPVNSNTIYATLSFPEDPTEPAAPTEGVYQSTDSGQSWKKIYASPYDNTFDIRIAVSPANAQTLYVYAGGVLNREFDVRVVVSQDGGATWVDRGGKGLDTGQFAYNTYLAVDPTNENRVFIGTRDVFRSENGGRSWKNLNDNFTEEGEFTPDLSNTHPDQHAIAFSPTSSEVIYFGNDGGLFKSIDGGNTLQSLNQSLSLTQFVDYVVHPTNPLISYGGTQDNGTQRRVSGGQVWQDFIGGDGGKVVINPLDPSEVFTTIYFGLGIKTKENGDLLPNELTTYPELFGAGFGDGSIGFYPPFAGNGVDNKLYFGSWRLFISNDFGDTWYTPGWRRDLTKGPPDILNAIAVSRSNTNVIYTGSFYGRAMVTGNGGRTWFDITAGLPNRTITSITVDRATPLTAYVTLSGFGAPHVFRTNNGGANWTNLSTGLPDIPVNTLLLDPTNPTTLYIGTDIGVFRSTNNGANWQYFSKGLPPVVVTSLTAQASGLIQAGTYGRGAYELVNNPTTSQENAK